MHPAKWFLPGAAVVISACSHQLPQAEMTFQREEADIRQVLEDQQAAWNRGDIPAFMQGYWKSDELRFASGGTVAKGWQVTLDRYLKRYDSPEKMGKLSFTDLIVTQLSATDAMVFGRWKLIRESDTPNGLFTLHFRKISDEWVIVSDHTSSSDK